jgi:hypothetical protein
VLRACRIHAEGTPSAAVDLVHLVDGLQEEYNYSAFTRIRRTSPRALEGMSHEQKTEAERLTKELRRSKYLQRQIFSHLISFYHTTKEYDKMTALVEKMKTLVVEPTLEVWGCILSLACLKPNIISPLYEDIVSIFLSGLSEWERQKHEELTSMPGFKRADAYSQLQRMFNQTVRIHAERGAWKEVIRTFSVYLRATCAERDLELDSQGMQCFHDALKLSFTQDSSGYESLELFTFAMQESAVHEFLREFLLSSTFRASFCFIFRVFPISLMQTYIQ